MTIKSVVHDESRAESVAESIDSWGPVWKD